MAFFDVDRAICLRGCDEKVGLAAQECWYLHRIDDRADGRALVRCVDVGDGFKAIFSFDPLKNFHAFAEPGAAVAADGGAVCFVEGAFKENVQL